MSSINLYQTKDGQEDDEEVVDPVPSTSCLHLLANRHYSLKHQLLIFFGIMTLVAGGITLAICLGVLYSLGDKTTSDSKSIILDQTRTNAANLAKEIANAINQQLEVIGESVCMVSATYSTSLLNGTDPTHPTTTPLPYTIMKKQNAYREYNFVHGCQYPACPSDFGFLSNRSRIPELPDFEDGSVQDASSFLYSSLTQSALRNDSDWNFAFSDFNQSLTAVQNSFAIQNPDLQTMYTSGPNNTVMFYLSAKIEGVSSYGSHYYAYHNTFPGIRKNDTNYNPATRPWFALSTSHGLHLYGPYQESFTKQLVLTLSYKSVFPFSSYKVSIVGAAVMLLSDLQKIVNAIVYTDEGFGAVVNTATGQVLAWGDRTDIFNTTTNTFKTLSDFDAALAGDGCLGRQATFDHTDDQGRRWIVSCLPFLSSTSPKGNSFTTSQALTMIVFADHGSAVAPLTSLNNNVDDTTSSVTISTVIIICATIGGVMLLTFLTVLYITWPLEVIRHISKDLVHIMAEDAEQRDFTPLLQRAYFNLSRTDEVGLLASDFYHVLCLLHNQSMEKKATPKYPANPFFWNQPITRELTWTDLYVATEDPDSQIAASSPQMKGESKVTSQETTRSLDVLASLAAVADAGDIEAPAETNSSSPCSPPPSAAPVSLDEVNVSAPSGYISISNAKPVGWCFSVKSQLSGLSLLLLAGLVATMVVTVVIVNNEGQDWSSDTGDQVTDKQVQNLQAVAQTKATYVETYFAQMTLDLLAGANYFTLLMDGNITLPNWNTNGKYLPSYAIDPRNPYSSSTYGNFSAYYSPADLNCFDTSDDCATVQNANETRLTSLLDAKFTSYFYPNAYVSFMQMGMADDGFTRYWPYRRTTTNNDPTSCLITSTNSTFCYNLYYSSACGDSTSSYYPPYETKCRDWYAVGDNHHTAQKVYFMTPRLASDGTMVLTGVVNIYANNDPSRTKYAVLISNFLASELSNSINKMKILDSGYYYLVERSDPNEVVIHPDATATCTTVTCTEGMSSSEFTTFEKEILLPAAAGLPLNTSVYKKGGDKWRVNVQPVTYGTVSYLLVATVPESEVLEASRKTTDSINTSVTGMIVGFAVTIAVYCIVLGWSTRLLIRSIVHPIDDLRVILQQAQEEDFSSDVPTKATSLDLAILMEALSQLLVALRFGSDSYARGDIGRARQVFTDALNLFTVTENQKGIGASLNNLAAVYLSLGDHAKAEKLYKEAIEKGKELMAAYEERASKGEDLANEIKKLQRLISDREGNLAVVYLQQNDFSSAFAILERLLEEDKQQRYIKGCVVKQGTLGQFYLQQGEIQSAERVFHSALDFLRSRMSLTKLWAEDWREEEWDAAEQIALYNMALLQAKSYEALEKDRKENLPADIKAHAFLLALMSVKHIDVSTTKKILQTLAQLYKDIAPAQQLITKRANEQKIYLNDRSSTSKGNKEFNGSDSGGTTKRIIFAIDYSGSMSGTKIRSAVENLRTLVQKHLHLDDIVSLLSFDGDVHTLVPLGPRRGRDDIIEQGINSLTSPCGGTAFYDALIAGIDLFRQKGTRNDWIVALTDGEDNSSRNKLHTLVEALGSTMTRLMIIGVGSDVRIDVLTTIAKSTLRESYFISATADKKGIDDAFGQVAVIIQNQVILEDY